MVLDNMLLLGMLVAMMAIFIFVYYRSGSLRLAFIVSLILGKTWTVILWAFGQDRTIFNIIVYNKVSSTASVVPITATQVIFLSFLVTLLVTISWPYIEAYLPEPIRRMEVIR